MTDYLAAFAALAGVLVPGVRRSYPLGAPPETLARPSLPALVLLAGDQADGGGTGLFPARAEAVVRVTISGGAREGDVLALHLLLVARETRGPLRARAVYETASLVDAYLHAVAAAPTLGGVLAAPLRCTASPGLVRYRGALWHGCTFQHTWRIAVGT